jgi:predicted HTH domain antitoxin
MLLFRRKIMSLTISDEILSLTRMSESELKQEIAIMLFQKEKLTLGQASNLAEMNQFQFQNLLASRQIPLHYDLEDLDADVKTLGKLGRL